MQTAEIIFRLAGAMVLWAFIGFVVAVVLKAFKRSDQIPAWPIAVFVLIGVVVSISRQSSAGLL